MSHSIDIYWRPDVSVGKWRSSRSGRGAERSRRRGGCDQDILYMKRINKMKTKNSENQGEYVKGWREEK